MQVSQLQQLKETLLWQQLHEELKVEQQELVQVSWKALCSIWTELAQLITKSFKTACLEDNKEQTGQHSREMQALKIGAAKSL